MSMICSILGVTSTQIDELIAAPKLVRHLVLVATDETRRKHFDEIIGRLPQEQRQRAEASRAADDHAPAAMQRQVRIAEAREQIARLGSFEPPLCLEKWWHILHYLLAGDVGPVGGHCDLLLTGEELGEDMGYGPARLHGPTETENFSRFLETEEFEDLQARIDLGELRRVGVYPSLSKTEDENVLRNDVGRYFLCLQDYVDRMSDKGNGLLIWVV